MATMKIAHFVATLLVQNDGAPCVCVPPTLCHPTATIAFGGTRTWQDLVFDDLNVRPKRWPVVRNHPSARVHGGFAERTRRLLREMDAFVREHDTFVVGGHSLGSACACLAASHLEASNKTVLGIYTFGAPRLASPAFQDVYRRQGLWEKTHNFVTPRDPIVQWIPKLYRELGSYTLLPFEGDSVWVHHDLETYHALTAGGEQEQE